MVTRKIIFQNSFRVSRRLRERTFLKWYYFMRVYSLRERLLLKIRRGDFMTKILEKSR